MQYAARFRHVANRVRSDTRVRRRFASTARSSRQGFRPTKPPAGTTYQQPPQSPPSAPPPQEQQQPQSFTRSRAVPWVFSSIFAGALAFYVAQLYVAANQPCTNPAIAQLSAQKDVSGRYDFTADGFDSEVGLSEMLMGVNRLRRQLAHQCRGHVLEVSCGTGRNLGYYDLGAAGKVQSLTFVDLSPQMVEVCRKKWDALLGKTQRESLRKGLVVRFLPGSAAEEMPGAPVAASDSSPRKYDTIIQTMGLCSTPTPVELLVNTVQYLDMSKEDSRILLLEHGRSYQSWLNRILDNAAEKHAAIHGCWFNRDIGALVQQAAEQTGLEIVNERRHHFGTTWMFELKPKAGVQNKLDAVAENKIAEAAGATSWFRWK